LYDQYKTDIHQTNNPFGGIMKKKVMLVVGLFLFIPFFLFAQSAGDYGSVGTGNWGTTGANWLVFVSAADWSDATAAPGAPTSSNNVWIRSGHTVNMEASSKVCKNLTIESTGALTTSAAGSSLSINGNAQIDGALGTASAGPVVQFSVSGTIFGSGSFYFSKLRPNANSVKITVDMNINGYTATGNFINCNNKSPFTLEVKGGKSITLPTGGYISTQSNSSTSDPGTGANVTWDVYGTITAPASSGGGISLANLTGFTSTLNIYSSGVVNTGRLSAIAAGTADPGSINVNINNGGTLTLTGPLSNDATKAILTIDGTFDCGASLSRAFSTANINSTGILRLMDGSFPTGTVNLNSGSTVEYYGTSAFTIPASPATYENFISNNSGGLTVGGPLTVNGVLTLAAGNLDNSVNQITLGPSGSVNYAGGTITDTPLPVEITSFSAIAKGKSVELAWNTATEVNNSGFEVERRVANKEWSKIGFVGGNGTSNSAHSYSYSDKAVSPATYQYRLKQIDRDGKFEYSATVEATVGMTVGDYQLSQNYPNPFNPTTTFTFALGASEQTTVKVFNIVGQEVATLFNGVAQANQMYSMQFNAKDLPSGIYFYTLRSQSRNEVKKMMLMK
jgi:hypothetical protein